LLCGLILASALLGFLVLPLAAQAAAAGTQWFVLCMLGLVLAQTMIAGAAFPLICYLGVAPDGRTGIGVSRVYVANIVGSATGALLTGFVLMDVMSTARINVVLAMLGAATSVAVAIAGGAKVRAKQRLGLVALAGSLIIACPLVADALFDRFYERLIHKQHYSTRAPFVDVVENRSGVVTVDAEGMVFGGGVYDGLLSVDLIADRNALIRPTALSLLHRHPRDVLMIGLATGAWAQVVAANPDVERLTIVEINPGYLRLIAKYPVVSTLLQNPKVEIIIDDGRRWLNRHADRKFDAIIQNTTWHFRPNVTNLLSAEYLRLVNRHLRPDGIMMYNTTDSLRAMVTGCAVFPHALRVLNMLAASQVTMVPDPAHLRATLEGLVINGSRSFDLSNAAHRTHIDDVVRAMRAVGETPDRVLESCNSLRMRGGGLASITDDNMGEEW
jgi:predicted membrane-bound spermidine synthase